MDKPTRPNRSRPHPPRLADPRRRLPGCAGPDPGRIPAAQGSGARPRSLRRRAGNTTQADPGRAGAPWRQPDRASPSPIGALPGCRHGHSHLPWIDPPPHPGRSRSHKTSHLQQVSTRGLTVPALFCKLVCVTDHRECPWPPLAHADK